MPIKLTPIVHRSLVHGYTWEVTDEKLLAQYIARVALGQSRHVQKILSNVDSVIPEPLHDGWISATKMLTADGDPWHRDGWMFQVMSWLSAHKAGGNSLINTPQMILAQKGFDGLQIDFDASGAICAVVIFEDKATESPRDTIRTEVWPDFELYENGHEANVLVSEVSSLLEKRKSINVDEVVRRVIWKDVRQYRVSITVGELHNSDSGRGRLFKDYDDKIPGDVKRRRGETFYVKDLRGWMSNVAAEALAQLAKLKAGNV